jgi:hypothetical protein
MQWGVPHSIRCGEEWMSPASVSHPGQTEGFKCANVTNKIILDSGATDHMFCNKKVLTKLEPIKDEQFILVANGMKAKINGKGEIN